MNRLRQIRQGKAFVLIQFIIAIASHGSAAVIPQDQKIPVCRVLPGRKGNKIRQGAFPCHAARSRTSHIGKALLIDQPSFLFFGGDLIQVPPFRTAGLQYDLKVLPKVCLQHLLNIITGAAVHAL